MAFEMTAEEGVIRIHQPGFFVEASHNTRLALKALADEYDKLKLKLKAAEQALRDHQTCYEKLARLPELNRSNFSEDQAFELNDGVCEVCCEMETTKDEYDAAINKINSLKEEANESY